MVLRTTSRSLVGMNSSLGGDREGDLQNQRDYTDGIMSSAIKSETMTTTPALSPPNDTTGYDLFEEPHNTREDGDTNSEYDEGYDRDSVSSSDQPHQLRSYAQYAEPPQPVLPQSPMVTPPATRSYQRAAAVVEPAMSLGASSFKKPVYQSYPDTATAPPPSVAVPHVYHDHSQVPDDGSFIRKKTGGVTQPFPEKLHEMLRQVEPTDASEIVGWLPHGRAFIVRKPKEFTEGLMPKYFKQTKLTSFQRQLNLYGFRRLTQGADSGAYYHEMFLRARPGLCQRMARQKVKGTGHKQPADATTEPNFYEMRPADDVAAVASNAMHAFRVMDAAPSQSLSQASLYQDVPTQEPASSTMAPTHAEHNIGSYPSPAWTFRQPPLGTMLSPASPGLHGAAHMLQNIASGYGNMTSSLRMPIQDASLGTSAEESITNDDGPGVDPSSTDTSNERRPVGSFLQPRLSSPFDFSNPNPL